MPAASPVVWPSQPLVCPDAVVAGLRASENCRVISSGRVLPSRDAVPAGAVAVFGHNWCLAVRSDRSALWRPRQEQCRPVPARLDKCCNGHKSAGNAHKGRVQRQSDDLPCPDRLSGTGWAERNEPTIQKEYSGIRYVGTEPNPIAGAPAYRSVSLGTGAMSGWRDLVYGGHHFTIFCDDANSYASALGSFEWHGLQ